MLQNSIVNANTRTYKYSFDLNPQWVNGRLEAVNFNLHNAMFYPNSYLNFNNDGHYTKHYYNGMERIASRLGDQNLPINVNDPELQDRKEWQDSLIRKNVTEITGYEFLPVGEEQTPEDPKPVFELPQIGITGLHPIGSGSVYYYHSNHLGSTCYVTDGNASVQQGFLYAPFGEITNEYNNSFGSSVLPKYSFNAKELDEETGMYYYEARYYQPPTFTSRDVLFEEKPWLTPYGYCRNNPVIYIDPSGNDEWKLDKTGYVTCIKNTNDNFDRLYAVKDDGDIQEDNYLDMEKGILSNHDIVDDILCQSSDGTTFKASIQIFGNFGESSSATSFFKFVAKNTFVEWSIVSGVIGDKNAFFVGTTNYENTDASQSYIATKCFNYQTNDYVFSANHSHPNDSKIPSPGDVNTAKKIKSYYPQSTFNIYTPSTDKYHSFNDKTTPGVLDPVVIKAKRLKK